MVERRKYELKKRAERLEEVRRRIVDAAVDLHREVGPAATTVSEIARRAGVGRPTFYRHFPTEEELYGACGERWMLEHPGPDPRAWRRIEDPEERLRHGLRAMYAHYRLAESQLANVLRDAPLVPPLRKVLDENVASYVDSLRAALLHGWGVRGRRRVRMRAALTLALDLRSWQALTGGGLSDAEAAEVAAGAVLAAAGEAARPRGLPRATS